LYLTFDYIPPARYAELVFIVVGLVYVLAVYAGLVFIVVGLIFILIKQKELQVMYNLQRTQITCMTHAGTGLDWANLQIHGFVCRSTGKDRSSVCFGSFADEATQPSRGQVAEYDQPLSKSVSFVF
jgi:hypothetical protein